MMQFIIISKNKTTGKMSMAENPKIHDSFSSACTEAERLASKCTDKEFVVMLVKSVFASVDQPVARRVVL